MPNPDYSQADWDEVSDTPELTDAEIADLRPNGEGLPAEFADAFKRLGGRPKSEAKAVPVSLRVPPDVLAAYKVDGPGWQTRMNEALVAGCASAGKGTSRKTEEMVHLAPWLNGTCDHADDMQTLCPKTFAIGIPQEERATFAAFTARAS